MEVLNDRKIKPQPLITVYINENSSIENLNYIVKVSNEMILRKAICTEISSIADIMLRFLVPSLTQIEKYAKTPLFSIWDLGSDDIKREIGILIDNQCDEPIIRKRLEKMVNEIISYL